MQSLLTRVQQLTYYAHVPADHAAAEHLLPKLMTCAGARTPRSSGWHTCDGSKVRSKAFHKLDALPTLLPEFEMPICAGCEEKLCRLRHGNVGDSVPMHEAALIHGCTGKCLQEGCFVLHDLPQQHMLCESTTDVHVLKVVHGCRRLCLSICT